MFLLIFFLDIFVKLHHVGRSPTLVFHLDKGISLMFDVCTGSFNHITWRRPRSSTRVTATGAARSRCTFPLTGLLENNGSKVGGRGGRVLVVFLVEKTWQKAGEAATSCVKQSSARLQRSKSKQLRVPAQATGQAGRGKYFDVDLISLGVVSRKYPAFAPRC